MLKVFKVSFEVLNRFKVKVIIDVDNGVVNFKIKCIKEEFKSILNKIRFWLDVDIGFFILIIYVFKKLLDVLLNKKIIKVDVDINGLKKVYVYIIKVNDNF